MGRRTRLYMAYGSNMNLEQMADRCRTAEVVGKGILKNYELLFRGARHGAVATVEPREGSSVPVVLWEIGAWDEVALDCYEGYPRLYGKQMMEVEVDGKCQRVMAYVMTPGREFGIPSEHYAEIIREGYRSAGFDVGILEDAIQRAYGLAEKKPAGKPAGHRRCQDGILTDISMEGGGLVPVSGAVFAVKAALTAMTDERVRTAVLSVTAAICIPFFLIISVMVCFLSGTADHNRQAVFLSFYGSGVSLKMPEEYRSYVRDMQESFQDLDREIGKIKEDVREGTLDADMVKAYFYALFFGTEQGHMRNADYRKFAECFVSFEEIEDEEGNIVTVRVPVSDQNQICQSLSQLLGKEIRVEEKTNARRIYSLVKQGGGIGGEISGEAGEAMGDGSFAALMEEARKYIGMDYVWGGSSPAAGFDCSGYICWVYTQSGVCYLPRTTAQGIYDQCASVSQGEAQPGDLVFFTETYASGSAVSHVGIYVGGGRMLHAGDPIGYADLNAAYWRRHLYGYGRLF